MPNDLPFEDTLPVSEPALTGEPDHTQAGDDVEDWDNIEGPEAGETVHVAQADAEPGPDHPSNPGGLYPIPPKPALSVFVAISNEERLEKGELYAKKMVEIEGMQKERSEITAEINKAQKLAIILRTAFLSGKVEVPAEQTDLLRQPVGPESAAKQFADMKADAEAAQAAPAAVQGDDQAVADLNQMAQDIQAGKPGTEPSDAFLNDIEEHKAKSAAKRKGKAR